MANSTAHTMYGAPQTLRLAYDVAGDQLNVSVLWQNKTATRLAEAMWLSFVPLLAANASWEMDVIGHRVLPAEVVTLGTRHKVCFFPVCVFVHCEQLELTPPPFCFPACNLERGEGGRKREPPAEH